MEFDKETFKKMFPNLAKELETDEDKVTVNSVRTDDQTAEKASSQRFINYVPDVIDFSRRCDNEKQAEEIIDFLEKRNEIDNVHARRLKRQLREKGVRSFGPKKQDDYYSRKGIV